MKIETVSRLYSDIALYKVVKLDRYNDKRYLNKYIVDYGEVTVKDRIKARETLSIFYNSPVEALTDHFINILRDAL